jgi:integrase
MTAKRQRNDGLRKICKCPLRNWARCSHPWYFSYKPKGGARVRVSLDRHTGEHVGTLDEAKTIAANLRTAIVNGEYPPAPQATEAPAAPVTLRTAADRFLEGVPVLKGKNQGKARGVNDRQKLAALCAWTPVGVSAPLGDHLPSALTEDVLEAFVAHLRDAGPAASTVNKYIQTLKALDRWLTKKGYRPTSALSGESETLRRRQGTKRDRRLVPDTIDDEGKLTHEGEEKRLLKAAGTWLQRLIIAALETGARCGELLALTWGDVDLTRGELRISGDANKTGDGRRLPISTRLRSVLETVRLDPAGNRLPHHAHVFGDALGERVGSIKKAWETTVLKAHGFVPTWTAKRGLSRESRKDLQAIDLHWHDLRHEAGSRFLEAGWPLHHVQKMLGHVDAKQTATYLNADRVGLHDSMKRFGTTPSWPIRGKAGSNRATA